MKLENKAAIVTGSGRGLGRAFAIAMAREGACIVVNDVNDDSAKKVVDEIREFKGRAVSVVGSVDNREIAEKMVDASVKEFGKLNALVNNAGITRDVVLHKMTEEQWDDVVNCHLKGTFLCTQAAVKWMKESIKNGKQESGRIINITSAAGIYGGNIGQANYAAAKAGIIGFTQTVAKECVRHRINVNAVYPRARSVMTESIPEEIRKGMYEKMIASSVIGRLGEPDDVAPLIVFLASDDSYYITGQVIGAQGGPPLSY